MRTLISIIAALLVLNANLNIPKAQKDEERDLMNPLTVKEVRQVMKRIPRLKKGMSPEQVRAFLGLGRYHVIREGSGPLDDFRVIYHLRSDYTLLLIYDVSAGLPGKYKRGAISKRAKHER